MYTAETKWREKLQIHAPMQMKHHLLEPSQKIWPECRGGSWGKKGILKKQPIPWNTTSQNCCLRQHLFFLSSKLSLNSQWEAPPCETVRCRLLPPPSASYSSLLPCLLAPPNLGSHQFGRLPLPPIFLSSYIPANHSLKIWIQLHSRIHHPRICLGWYQNRKGVSGFIDKSICRGSTWRDVLCHIT